MPAPASVLSEPGVFAPGDVEAIAWYYQMHGYAVVRGLLDEASTDRMQAECEQAQRQVVAGELPERYGSTRFLDEESKAAVFANYVEHVSELSACVRETATHPGLVLVLQRLLGPDAWLGDTDQFGIVYQDARPGRESGYTRIGWHSDWQASPSLDVWPATSFTVHLDATSPANGFLRVVPGSHLWATPAPYRNANGVEVPSTARPAGGWTTTPPPFPMPLGFEKVRGEVALYAERGDVILHDSYVWHSAARATDDEALRRHVRGTWFGGSRLAADVPREFVKNAAR